MKVLETAQRNDLVITSLRGEVTATDAARWRDGLHAVIDALPDGTAFKLLVNFHGYEPADPSAHKEMRTVVPELLARHGFRAGYITMFEPVDVTIRVERGIRCTAAAHVHHDPEKMHRYETKYSSEREHFFTDPQAAEQWLESA